MKNPVVVLAAVLFAAFAVALTIVWAADKVSYPVPPPVVELQAAGKWFARG